ncbi:glycoprotein Xg isoform X1 [Sphaerodactylus townsendi]|uniref:glycoprotein Xg isoform X1 n=1 Tax=Sphaerodactylus townsendi TaxID=933632 RepID=UPI0020260EF6|nr:glycoprotein Xg isoform X1 [Sphaerodactylus townsendi]
MVKLTVALLCAGCFLLHVSGQEDFDLSDALDSVTKQPPTTKKPPVGNRPKPLYPTLRPQPGGHGNRDDHLKPQPYPHPPPQPGGHGDSGNRPKPLYPTLRPQPGGHGNRDDYFDLSDALGGNDDHLKPWHNPHPKPQPGSHGDSGSFTDLDLSDGKPLPPRSSDGNEHISTNGGNTADSTKTAQITSPVVSVLVLCAVGGLVAYNAYKKQRYCFKPRGTTAA